MMRRWKERKPLTMRQKDSILGFVLILPVVLLIALVILYPILYNIRLSFFDVALNPNKPDVFVGVDTYMVWAWQFCLTGSSPEGELPGRSSCYPM